LLIYQPKAIRLKCFTSEIGKCRRNTLSPVNKSMNRSCIENQSFATLLKTNHPANVALLDLGN